MSAEGNVQLYYQGRVLEADKVIYNRKTNRVFAEGNAKLTEADGSVTYGDRFDLTDDFKSGFIDSLSAVSKDKTRFTAPRGERSEGETSVLDKATYTACEPCKEHPGAPAAVAGQGHEDHPQSRRADDLLRGRVLRTLSACRSPISPICRAPTRRVTRKSGFLAPALRLRLAARLRRLGALFLRTSRPNYDLTLTPTVLSQAGRSRAGRMAPAAR